MSGRVGVGEGRLFTGQTRRGLAPHSGKGTNYLQVDPVPGPWAGNCSRDDQLLQPGVQAGDVGKVMVGSPGGQILIGMKIAPAGNAGLHAGGHAGGNVTLMVTYIQAVRGGHLQPVAGIE